MDELTREQAIRLLDGGLDLGLQMAAAQYVMPICWIASDPIRKVCVAHCYVRNARGVREPTS